MPSKQDYCVPDHNLRGSSIRIEISLVSDQLEGCLPPTSTLMALKILFTVGVHILLQIFDTKI